ncbi:formimidoylglutamase [Gramella sp. GC03-9]|uniref:Formimidoylglutamase n=1 Tax=Christiangramia oceanisediminis TaxID=2920386 RepID=A0A9X2KZA1_9FLAO|nr:formimidoylglutamase [Gramella oceanisediminis]MCP9200946.1 formimidoylglutamase [Gramella oceanisediminis]
MNGIKLCKPEHIDRLVAHRQGELKFGEKLQFVSNIEELKEHKAKYVILGISEDIGVRANHGRPGTSGAWDSFLSAFVNIQVNRFNNPENCILLGELECRDLMEKAEYIDDTDPNYHIKLGDMVEKIDDKLSTLIEQIIRANKIPVVIGGGHNNSFGNIKGASRALEQPINVINIDAHTDLRQLEHRHSGNGFSYAIEGWYLRNYSIFGLHKNYTPEYIFRQMEDSENIRYELAEDLLKLPNELPQNFEKALQFVGDTKFGFELDCDAIAHFPSSAISPAGFRLEQVRNFVSMASKNKNCCYFHICEAAPGKDNSTIVGKALTYLVTDFIGKSQPDLL